MECGLVCWMIFFSTLIYFTILRINNCNPLNLIPKHANCQACLLLRPIKIFSTFLSYFLSYFLSPWKLTSSHCHGTIYSAQEAFFIIAVPFLPAICIFLMFVGKRVKNQFIPSTLPGPHDFHIFF